MKGTQQSRRSAAPSARAGVRGVPTVPAEALGPVVRELVGQLWESEQRYRLAFEQSPVGMAYTTLNGHFVAANEMWCRLTGHTRKQLATLSLADLAAQQDYARHVRLGRDLLTGRIASYTLQTCRVREDGGERWLQFDVCLCHGAGGEPLYLLASVHDVSLIKELEQRQALAQASYAVERAAQEHAFEELRKQVSSLKSANEAMERFLAVVSHELLTPLTIIRTSTQLLARRVRRRAHSSAGKDIRDRNSARDLAVGQDLDQDGDLDLLGRVDVQVQALSRALEDMVQVARVGAGMLELEVEPLDLLALVRTTVADQQLTHADRRILLEGLPQPGDVVPVVADGVRIRQVVANYLTNALKYSPVERAVRVAVSIECGPRGQQVARVAVCDDGVGIAPEEQARVWERFHRVPGVRVQTRSGANLGLGLHICQNIVERHGGEVGLSSTPGVGSTFWFSLPLAQGYPTQNTTEQNTADTNADAHDDRADNRARAVSV